MRGWSFTMITIILSNIILLVLKDLLANFIAPAHSKTDKVHGCVSSNVTSQVSMTRLVSRLSTRKLEND
jgi:hypothetical protein